MKNVSKSLGYPILDDVIILMAMGILQYHLLYG
jgi:hypothetical protein